MPDYTNHGDVMIMLRESQDAEHDNREKVREAHLFIDKRDGQWEPYWWQINAGKPRYTFDMTSPVVDQVAGYISESDFNITVKPAGGEATKEIAATYDGLIRNIENISNATHIFNSAARSMIVGGMDGWRIKQKYVDGDSFDQDLIIERISNFGDRVWFEASAEEQDKSDAKFCWVLQAMSPAEYKERWPDGSESSISTDEINVAYYYKPNVIVVGEFYYKEEVERELVLMSDGKVLEVNDDYQLIRDELESLGITELRRRKRKKDVVHMRVMDNNGWLEEAKETVFSYLPVVPIYGNFKIIENKTVYWGIVEKLQDPQRVLNYSLSREIEEGALAPRAKYWMTNKQMAGHEDTLATLNTNSDPVQTFNPDPLNPGSPVQDGGAQINPGLRNISDTMHTVIGQSAGMFAANMGDNPNAQSGVAIGKLQDRGEIGNNKYAQAQEIGIAHTGRILIDAAPRVYDTQRIVRILKEDGSFDMSTLNEQVRDEQTGQMVTLNDLSVGKYDVTCVSSPAYKNRQDETVSTLIEASKVDPTLMQIGSDIFLNSVNSPGIDLIAARKRQQLFEAGIIPFDQLSDEEKDQLQAMSQQPKQPDAAMVLAQAEDKKAQADLMRVQLGVAQLESKDEGKDQEFMLKIEKMQQDLILSVHEQSRKNEESLASIAKTNAETLEHLKTAMGAESIIGAPVLQAYQGQVEEILENQAEDVLQEIP